MVSVIVDNRDAAYFAAHLKSPVHSVEGRKTFADEIGLDFKFHRDGDRSHRVQHVVTSGNSQLESAQVRGAIANVELAGKRSAEDIGGFDIGLRAGAIGNGTATDL